MLARFASSEVSRYVEERLSFEVKQRVAELDLRIQKLELETLLSAYVGASIQPRCEPLRIDGRKFRVGLSMNLANNLFHLSNGLRDIGVDAELVLYRQAMDYRPLGDPRWETTEMAVEDLDSLTLDHLPPGLPQGVVEVDSDSADLPGELHPLAKSLVGNWINFDRYLKQLQQYDVLLVSGPAIAFAPLTGVPYVTFPYGGDLRIDPIGDTRYNRLMMAGWRRANAHIFGGTNFLQTAENLGLKNHTYLPIFVDTNLYQPMDGGELRARLLAEHQCQRLLLMASRHNWQVKGQDKVIQAMARLKSQGEVGVKLLMTTWGPDYERTQQLVQALGVQDLVAFIPTMSKALLKRHIAAADMVLDQFTLGEYGTFALEAMAMARPVLMYYRYEHAPPLMNVCSSEEIADALIRGLAAPHDMEALGRRARDWVMATHGTPVVSKFIAVFESVMAGERVPAYPPFMA